MTIATAETATLFVGIPSYRDPQLIDTVLSLIQNAKHPERLVIAIFHQLDLTCQTDQSINSELNNLVQKY